MTKSKSETNTPTLEVIGAVCTVLFAAANIADSHSRRSRHHRHHRARRCRQTERRHGQTGSCRDLSAREAAARDHSGWVDVADELLKGLLVGQSLDDVVDGMRPVHKEVLVAFGVGQENAAGIDRRCSYQSWQGSFVDNRSVEQWSKVSINEMLMNEIYFLLWGSEL